VIPRFIGRNLENLKPAAKQAACALARHSAATAALVILSGAKNLAYPTRVFGKARFFGFASE
jgi:hypothetical protein